VKFSGWPGKHKHVMAFTGRHLRRGVGVNSLDGNDVEDYIRVIFFAPLLDPFCFEPGIIPRNEMSPFRDLQRPGGTECSRGKVKEGAGSRSNSRKPDEIPARKAFLHLDFGPNSHPNLGKSPPASAARRGPFNFAFVPQRLAASWLKPPVPTTPKLGPSLLAPEPC
jgi:hypothetical protein